MFGHISVTSIKVNKKDDKGSPCLSPQEAFYHPSTFLLTKVGKLTVHIYLFIYF